MRRDSKGRVKTGNTIAKNKDEKQATLIKHYRKNRQIFLCYSGFRRVKLGCSSSLVELPNKHKNYILMVSFLLSVVKVYVSGV